jgi:hypothetical protein
MASIMTSFAGMFTGLGVLLEHLGILHQHR